MCWYFLITFSHNWIGFDSIGFGMGLFDDSSFFVMERFPKYIHVYIIQSLNTLASVADFEVEDIEESRTIIINNVIHLLMARYK